jgi:hypothetical protein
MTATVTKIHPSKPARSGAGKDRSKATASKYRRQALAGTGVGIVAGSLVALSLTHLATGIQVVTGSPQWESWSMAIGVDCGYVALELASLTAVTDAIRKAIGKFTRPAIIGTLAGSAALNAFAFGSQAQGWLVYPAIALGLCIPGLVYALTRVGAVLWIEGGAK